MLRDHFFTTPLLPLIQSTANSIFLRNYPFSKTSSSRPSDIHRMLSSTFYLCLTSQPQQQSFGTLWEVLNGVGVDGVGGIFPFFRFFSFFFVFLRFSSLFWHSPRGQGKQLQFTAKMGNFTPTPSAPTPCKTSRTLLLCFFSSAVCMQQLTCRMALCCSSILFTSLLLSSSWNTLFWSVGYHRLQIDKDLLNCRNVGWI